MRRHPEPAGGVRMSARTQAAEDAIIEAAGISEAQVAVGLSLEELICLADDLGKVGEQPEEVRVTLNLTVRDLGTVIRKLRYGSWEVSDQLRTLHSELIDDVAQDLLAEVAGG